MKTKVIASTVLILLVVAVQFLAVPPVRIARADTYTSQPDGASGVDTMIDSAYPTSNLGTNVAITVGERNDQAAVRRSLIYFDLSSIPVDATITSVTLSLWLRVDLSSTARTYNVYRSTRAWTEGGATWNRYDGTNNWATAGGMGAGDYDSTSIGSLSLTSSETMGVQKDITLSTSVIEDMVEGDLSNYGFLIAAETESDDAYSFYSSDEATETTRRPALVIEYITSTATPTSTFTPSSTPTNTATATSTFTPTVATGATFYVDFTGGNDSNTGLSTDQAWKTITKLNSVTFSGANTVYFKRGETWSGIELLARSGVTYAAYGAGALPIIDANSSVYAAILADGVTNVTLRDLDLRNGTSVAVEFDSSSNITITDCNMSGAGNDNLLFIDGSHDATVTGGVFTGAAPGGGHTGIEITDGSYNITIDGVESYGNPIGLSIHNHPATDMPDDIIVRNADIHDNTINGLQIGYDGDSGAVTISVENSEIYDNSSDGLQVDAIGANYISGAISLTDVILYGNVYRNLYIEGDDVTVTRMVSYKGDAATGHGVVISNSVNVTIRQMTSYHEANNSYTPLKIDGARTDEFTLVNSILAAGDTSTNLIEITAATDPTIKSWDIDYNLYSTSGAVARWLYNGTAYTFANWVAASGADTHSPTPASPRFTNAASKDFTLQASSPAIDIGLDLGLNFNGPAPDLGAYEHSDISTATPTRTATASFTPLPSATYTPTITETPTATGTPTATATFTPSRTPGGPAEISTSLTYGDMAVLAVLAALLLTFVIYGLIRWFQGYFDRKR